jgi:hypothetical protein
MKEFYVQQNDNGNTLTINLVDGISPVSLATANSVTFVLVRANTRILKSCAVVDANKGICQVTLASSDIATVGTYLFQVSVAQADGNVFTSNVCKLLVQRSL